MAHDRDAAAFVRRFHAARPGCTTAAFARGDAGGGASTYARLAACAPADARVLELGCGDGHLLAMLTPRAIGLDLSTAELALARARGARVIAADARAIPLPAASIDCVVSHLAFTLMTDVDAIAAELARVLAPDGRFAAIVGGGPAADAAPDDAFARFATELAAARPIAPRLGDPRARSEVGWHALLAPHGFHAIAFERIVVDLGGAFADVWTTLASAYETDGLDLAPLHTTLAARYRDTPRVPCTMVVWLATARR